MPSPRRQRGAVLLLALLLALTLALSLFFQAVAPVTARW